MSAVEATQSMVFGYSRPQGYKCLTHMPYSVNLFSYFYWLVNLKNSQRSCLKRGIVKGVKRGTSREQGAQKSKKITSFCYLVIGNSGWAHRHETRARPASQAGCRHYQLGCSIIRSRGGSKARRFSETAQLCRPHHHISYACHEKGFSWISSHF